MRESDLAAIQLFGSVAGSPGATRGQFRTHSKKTAEPPISSVATMA
jgi:hypothetical protein